MQNRPKPDIHIPNNKMQQSYYNWCQIPIVNKKEDWAMYWDYVGAYKQSNEGRWILTQDGAR